MEVIDNVSTLLGDDLKTTLKKDDRVRCIAPAFSIYAFDALRRSLERLDRFDFIFPGATTISS